MSQEFFQPPGSHAGAWNRQQLARLEHPDRERTMPKEPVLAALAIAPGMHIADIGAGVGYFTFPMARVVGTQGQVLAVDLSLAARDEITLRAGHLGLPQIHALLCGAERIPIADASVDRILWHTVYHDLANLPRAIGESSRILKPGGRWVIVDWMKLDTGMGPPVGIRVARDQAETQLTEQTGLHVVDRFIPGPVTWGLVMEKSANAG